MKFLYQLSLVLITLCPLIVIAVTSEDEASKKNKSQQDAILREREFWLDAEEIEKSGRVDETKKQYGLREEEKQALEKLRNKDVKKKKRGPSRDEVEVESIYLKNCQEALTKIDKLSVEINDVTLTQVAPGTLKNGEKGEKTKTPQGKTYINISSKDKKEHIKSQIKRYQMQAQKYCDKKYLKESKHFKKNFGGVRPVNPR